MDTLLDNHADEIRRIARAHGATRIRVVGSRARGEGKPNSDLDMLVDLERGRDLLDLIAIQLDLEELLGCKVDVGQGFHDFIDEREALRGVVEL